MPHRAAVPAVRRGTRDDDDRRLDDSEKGCSRRRAALSTAGSGTIAAEVAYTGELPSFQRSSRARSGGDQG
jgi:hypothetical protein